MKDGFLRCAAVSFEVSTAGCAANADRIVERIRRCAAQDVKLAVFPELCVTGYTCGDLFLQRSLLDGAVHALRRILRETADCDVLAAVGMPWVQGDKLYNVAAVIKSGRLLGVVPKSCIPNYTEYYEMRYFRPAELSDNATTLFDGDQIPFGTDLIFCARQMPEFAAAFEICEDLHMPVSPSAGYAAAGALVIGNLSASNESTGRTDRRRELVCVQSARLAAGYVYSSCGAGESSTDLVFSDHRLICENGNLLTEQTCYSLQREEIVATELDMQRLSYERRRMNTFPSQCEGFREIWFDTRHTEYALSRPFSCTPFVPSDAQALDKRCMEVLTIQALGLSQRIRAISARRVVIGLSGGLDSTLALLVAVDALRRCGREPASILAVTMPGPGTTERTLDNAGRLAHAVGAELRVIPINQAVIEHLKAIEHDGSPDVTFENAQARERMQILMDLANCEGGFVVGTPGLSEIALGFSTYGGDHMSMYGVNAGVPKTLIPHLISYIASRRADELKMVLHDVLDTPVSPELLPVDESGCSHQRTEEILGDYLLHDFILYYTIRYGFSMEKIGRLMKGCFTSDYSPEEIQQALDTFFTRFRTNQFKRSCMPDGVKVGSVSLSPRLDWRMPSDAAVWY